MKKWLILLAVPAVAFCNEGGFLIDIDEENALTNLAIESFEEQFAAHELEIFDLSEKEVSLSLWSDEILAKDLNDHFSFEDPLEGEIVPSPEHVPALHKCKLDIKALAP